MINQDVTYFYGDAQAVYQDFGGVVLDEAEGKRLAAALGPKGKGMILRNHGLLVSEFQSSGLMPWTDVKDRWKYRRRSCLPVHAHGALL